jgi:MFS family permease
MGSLLLGPLFDKIGRKPMIAGTYFLSAILLALTGVMFVAGSLTAVTQTLCWSIIFFVSSASSSAAYLTISEIFPLESTLPSLVLKS